MAYEIGRIIGVMFITALCSAWNYRKWREIHGHDRERQLLTSTVIVMILSFFGGVLLGIPATLISIWYAKKQPVLSAPQKQDDNQKAS